MAYSSSSPKKRVICLFILLSLSGCCVLPSMGVTDGSLNHTNDPNLLGIIRDCGEDVRCMPGVIIPVWKYTNEGAGEKFGHAVVYFLVLVYMFLGVSIIADRFMSSIEVITSKEKEVTVILPNGETSVTSARIWNETVSNLTLMALGSSAPEILLSVIEVCGHGFEAGDLGPSTIVGSAAFNMFVITAICVWVIPEGEVRKIKHLRVYFFTVFWSLFAYIWLFLILSVISPGQVEVWEALVTLLCFPVGVLLAWVIDRSFLVCASKSYRLDKKARVIVETESKPVPEEAGFITDGKLPLKSVVSEATPELQQDNVVINAEQIGDKEEDREEAVHILRELIDKYPHKSLDELKQSANYLMLRRQPKSRAYYRIQALRTLIGAGNVLKKQVTETTQWTSLLREDILPEPEDIATCSYISFDSPHYLCMEDCGSISLPVVCRGGTGQNTFYVDYRTEEGTAKPGSDYEHCEGTLVFEPGETSKEIEVVIINDDIFEEDEHFFVHLLYLRVGDTSEPEDVSQTPRGRLTMPLTATVTILDDDHAGIFSFSNSTMTVDEAVGTMEVTVCRHSGARGTVIVPYHTEQGSACGAGVHYGDTCGELKFINDQTTQTIEIRIINHHKYKTHENFFIVLENPRWTREDLSEDEGELSAEEEEARRIAEMGRPILGEHSRLEVVIGESAEFKATVDKLMQTSVTQVIGTHSWREQFVEALTVSAGEDDEEEEGAMHEPSCSDYVMHLVCFFWKVLFAFVPPTDYLDGWACFVVSISCVGVLTAIIGDLASHFGCTVGLKDSVTAVVFVALGTSVPDTFASKVAAIQDEYADASVGNVTGSNAVNVFLGIGVAWSISAIYWAINGGSFVVQPGSLAFSVTLFVTFAFVGMVVLLFRRNRLIGGELGGPRKPRIVTSVMFLSLWLLYILFSSLDAYCHIEVF